MNEQINQEATKSEYSFRDVAARLKFALSLPNDAALASALGLSRSNYANKKASGAIPYEAVLALSRERALNLEWVLWGEGQEITKNDHPDTLNMVAALGIILAEMSKAIEVVRSKNPGKWTAREPCIHEVGTFGALLYNRLKGSRFKDSEALIKAIRGQATELAQEYLIQQMLKYIGSLADGGKGGTHDESPK
jgi:hypothetical protein